MQEITRVLEIIKHTDKKIGIFGTKACAKMVFYALRNLGRVPAFFCVEEAEEQELLGTLVLNVEQIKGYKDTILVIASFKESTYQVVSNKFQSMGFEVYRKDALLWYYQTKVVSRMVDDEKYAQTIELTKQDLQSGMDNVSVVLTNRCTLRCRDCGRLTPYYEHPEHIDLKTIQKSVHKLAEAVEYIRTYVLFGGEPMLYPWLTEVCKAASSMDNVLTVDIITNGTIVPSDDVLKQIRDAGVYIVISDYGALSTKKSELIARMEALDVVYEVASQANLWHCVQKPGLMDFTEAELAELYDRCVHMKYECNELQNGRLYMCGYAAYGAVTGKIPLKENDYVNLLDDNITLSEIRDRIQDLFYHRKYIEACHYCRTQFDQFAPRAEQL